MESHMTNTATIDEVNQNVMGVYARYDQAKSTIQGIEAIDYFFAKEMHQALIIHKALNITTEHEKNLYHLFLALSVSLRAGHSCLAINNVADTCWGRSFQLSEQGVPSHAGFHFLPVEQLQQALASLKVQPIEQELLVFDDNKLYLRRYYQFEQTLANGIQSRLLQPCEYDNVLISQCIASLFPKGESISEVELDWQKIAVANAINKNFSVIAGGPGTGKTYTVTKLLAALIMLSKSSDDTAESYEGTTPINIALVAPTGKAAQRLSESIIDAVVGFKGLIDDTVLQRIPTQTKTIHRLLGVIPNSPNFRHHEQNLLPYDVVLIDEVSMVDLPLMTRIFRSLKTSAKVILLGDADQLPSVAAGSVLADIAPRPHRGFSVKNQEYLSSVCQLTSEQQSDPLFNPSDAVKSHHQAIDYLSFLIKSRRFDGKGGIGLIANEVINGQAKQSWQRLIDSRKPELDGNGELDGEKIQNVQGDKQLSLAEGELSHWLKPLVNQYYQPISHCSDVTKAFSLLAKFRVLCATRQGEYGVEQLNEVIKGYLGKSNRAFGLNSYSQSNYQSSSQSHHQALYHGQPIMINENDYRLGLYNGDIGIIWQVEDQQGNTHLMACFETNVEDQPEVISDTKPSVRKILPSRLPKYESVYAMTIHKTQGSEFSHVAMVLSASDTDVNETVNAGSKLLTRELLYTGITRAKKHITICANPVVWQQGVIGQVKRASGLQLS